MSLFAGIVTRRTGARIDDADRCALESLLVRDAALPKQVFRSDAYHLVHADLGSHGSPGTLSSGAGISLVAGDLVLDPPHARGTRAAELEVVHEAWCRGDDAPARRARGTFALAHVGHAPGRITLVTDRIGLRPLHLWMDDDRVVFSSSLRLLEQLQSIPKRVDLRGAGEILTFGYPLADRTPYAGIRRLQGGLRVEIEGGLVRETRYWRPEDVRQSLKPTATLERDAHEAFREAIRLRLRGDRSCLALLSGGLDSRCVVALLRDQGADVHTFSFTCGDEQDHIFSLRFAEAAGTRHRRFPMKPGAKPHWGLLARNGLDSVVGGLAPPPSRPTLLWTGDNGSFTVGFVHMSEELFAHLRAGREAAAVDEYLGPPRIPTRFLRRRVGARFASLARRGIAEQLAAIECDDPAKKMYVFYLMTEARHILSDYFEEIDRHRLDTPVPFCDGRLLEVMLSIPMDAGLRHEFYHRFLGHFPPVTSSVPWQVYPGHARCPIATTIGARTQWQDSPSRDHVRSAHRYHAEIAASILRTAPFPDSLVPRSRFRLAAWAHRARLRRFGYVFHAVAALQRICAVAGGRFDGDPSAPADVP